MPTGSGMLIDYLYRAVMLACAVQAAAPPPAFSNHNNALRRPQLQ